MATWFTGEEGGDSLVTRRFLALCFPLWVPRLESQARGANPRLGGLGTVVGLGGLGALSVPRRSL